MQKKTYILPLTLFVLAIIFCLLFISSKGWLRFFENTLQLSFFPIGKIFHQEESSKNEIEKLKAEIDELNQKLAQQQKVESDNKALRDQFENSTLPTTSLLPAYVVGQPSVIPNVIFPEELIIDKGEKMGVRKGMVVVVKDNAVGQVTQTSGYFAKVTLTSSKNFALSGKDMATGAVGVIKGQGSGNILFDAVLLSDTLHVGDLIVSQGSQDISGKGFPPNIIIGKITGVEKNPSALFQQAQVAPLLNLSSLSTVFVMQ